MEQQLCVYVKYMYIEDEQSARERIDNLQKKLAEAKGEMNALRQEINRQSCIIRKVCLSFNLNSLVQFPCDDLSLKRNANP